MNQWRGAFITALKPDIIKAVTLRLVNPTCKGRPGHKIVACHGPAKRSKEDMDRSQSVIEEVGYFDVSINDQGQRICLLDIAKIRMYLSQGAEPTVPVWKLLGASGAFPVHPKVSAQAAENQYLMELFPPKEEEQWDSKINQYDDKKEKGEEFKKTVEYITEQEQDCLTHLSRNRLQSAFAKDFWKLNYYDNRGKGRHGNRQLKYHENLSRVKKQRRDYWYWTREARTLGYTDPFKLQLGNAVRRVGENEELLKKVRPK